MTNEKIPALKPEEELVTFYHRLLKRFVTYIRHKVTKRFIKMLRRMWRLTKALNYWEHHKYYSMVFQAWFIRKEDMDNWIAQNEPKIDEEIKHRVANEVRYPPEEWWFPDKVNVETEEVDFEKDLIGKSEWRKEHVKG